MCARRAVGPLDVCPGTNEAASCYGEGVLRSVADANIGSIFGWGFAPLQGGALQFINAMGARRFVTGRVNLRPATAHASSRAVVVVVVVVAMAERSGRVEDQPG